MRCVKVAGKEKVIQSARHQPKEGRQEVRQNAKNNSLDTTLVVDGCIFGARLTDRQTPTIRSIPQRPSDPSKLESNSRALAALLSNYCYLVGLVMGTYILFWLDL